LEVDCADQRIVLVSNRLKTKNHEDLEDLGDSHSFLTNWDQFCRDRLARQPASILSREA
jgi:hypothetical protein